MKHPAALLLTVALLAALATAAPPKKDDTPVDKSPEHIAELIKQLEGGTMAERVRAKGAYKELQKIGRDAMPQLMEACKGKKPWAKVWACAALAGMRDPKSIDVLLLLFEDPLSEVRMICTWHIAGMHKLDKRIAPAIVKRLGDRSGDVAKWAQRAIVERLKFQGCMPGLQEMARSDSIIGRTMAYKLLLGRKHGEPGDLIEKTLTTEKDWRVRSAAIRCLGEGTLAPSHKKYFPLIWRAMDDASDEVKADAVELMEFVLKETADRMPRGQRHDITRRLEKKLPPLLDAKLPRLRGASLYLLAAGERDKLYVRALKSLDDPAPVVRTYALQALGRCGLKTRTVVRKAAALLDDEALEVRAKAFAVIRWATGARLQFDPKAPPAQRAPAAAKIRKALGMDKKAE